MLVPTAAFSQNTTGEGKNPSFLDRISVGTNVLDWLITVPNVEFGMDLSGSEYNRSSIRTAIKWNWDTYHRLPPYYVFNVFDIRGEYRYHLRFKSPDRDHPAKFFSLYKEKPRSWIAWYGGAYADFSSFAIKLTASGRQGIQGGAGLSVGLELPLYQYKKAVVDIDLGASFGVLYTNFKIFTLNGPNSAYVHNGEGAGAVPMVTELRAVLNIRRTSVRDKYVKSDPEGPIFKDALSDIRSSFEKTNKAAFDDSRDNKTRKAYAASDSLYRAGYVTWVQEEVAFQKNNLQYRQLSESNVKKLEKEIDRLGKKSIADFDAQIKDKNREAAKAQKAEQSGKEEKGSKADKPKKEKKEKPVKEKKAKEKKTKEKK